MQICKLEYHWILFFISLHSYTQRYNKHSNLNSELVIRRDNWFTIFILL